MDVFSGDDAVDEERERGFLEAQVDMLVSENPPMWLLLNDFKSDENRSAFLAFLGAELDRQPSVYAAGALEVIRGARNIIASLPAGDLSLLKPKWFIPWYEIAVERWVAIPNQGANGSFQGATWLGSRVVVRTSLVHSDDMRHAHLTDNDAWTMFSREVEIWFSLSHPHVLRLYGACHVGDQPFYVCEYASQGTLHRYFRSHPEQLWEKLYEVALGVEYLHERGIIHGALLGNNIVVAGDGKAKVTYFGLSAAAARNFNLPSAPKSTAWHWVAPECLMDKNRPSTVESESILSACALWRRCGSRKTLKTNSSRAFRGKVSPITPSSSMCREDAYRRARP